MTTIAYKDGLLVADTQITYDNSIRGKSAPKIWTLRPAVYFAGAGNTNDITLAGKFFKEETWEEKLGTNEVPKIGKKFEAILVFRGVVYTVDSNLIPEPLGDPCFSIGSGWALALAAMHMGLSAEEAVKFASELDIYTNNELQIVDVRYDGKAKKTRPTSASN